MESNTTLGAGAGVGLAAGAGTGLLVGSKKAANILKPYKGVGAAGTDEFVHKQGEFVSNAIKDAKKSGKIGNLVKTTGKDGKEVVTNKAQIREQYHKVKETAINKYTRLANELPEKLKTAKNSKNKWIAGLAVAGLAIGAGAAYLINKNNTAGAEARTDVKVSLNSHQG